MFCFSFHYRNFSLNGILHIINFRMLLKLFSRVDRIAIEDIVRWKFRHSIHSLEIEYDLLMVNNRSAWAEIPLTTMCGSNWNGRSVNLNFFVAGKYKRRWNVSQRYYDSDKIPIYQNFFKISKTLNDNNVSIKNLWNRLISLNISHWIFNITIIWHKRKEFNESRGR